MYTSRPPSELDGGRKGSRTTKELGWPPSIPSAHLRSLLPEGALGAFMVSENFLQRKLLAVRLVNRSPVLSGGAKRLYFELLLEWCWDAPICWPSQRLVQFALVNSRDSVYRWTEELVENKLVRRERGRKGLLYHVALDIPKEVCDPRRGDNVQLAALMKEQRKDVRGSDHVRGSDMVRGSDIGEQSDGTTMSDPERGDVRGSDHLSGGCLKIRHEDVRGSDQKHLTEASKEEEADKGKQMRAAPSAPHARENSSSKEDENHEVTGSRPTRDSVPGSDFDRHNSNGDGGKNETSRVTSHTDTADPATHLVASSGDPSQNDSQGRQDSETSDLDTLRLQTPTDVLRLLRGEVEKKFGEDGLRGLPLKLSGKEAGQIKQGLLDKFSTETVESIVRLLVWDWEVAKTECFPPRDFPYPALEALVKYIDQLAPRIGQGFVYKGAKRGATNTYSQVYLRGRKVEVNTADDLW